MSAMIVKRLVVGPLQANCYLLADEAAGQVAIIDPGGEGERIQAMIEEEGWKPVALVNTHGHIDHIAANAFLMKTYAMPLMIHAEDGASLTDADLNLSSLGIGSVSSPPADRLLHEGDIIEVGGLDLRVLHTPGHSPGGICLHLELKDEPDIVFTGDTLFAGGIGRTDFPGGSMEELMRSIRTKLLTLPGDTIIYPGHGPPSTIAREKSSNPFIIFPSEK